MIEADLLPDYTLAEAAGDILVVTRRNAVTEPVGAGTPVLSHVTLDRVRDLLPGADVYALEAEWRGFWHATGRPRLNSPDKAFLGWLRGRAPDGS